MPGPWEKYKSEDKGQAPWLKYQAKPEEQSFGDKALGFLKESASQPVFGSLVSGYGRELIGKGMKAIDAYTGAPTRASIYAAQNAESPSQIVPEAVKGFKEQFGNFDKEAPSGEQIVEKAGVPHGMGSKAAGFGVDMAANPLNFAGPMFKVAGEGVKALTPVADALSSFSHEKALKAAGAMTKDFKIINDKNMADTLGSFLLDNKIVTPLATVSKVADRLSEAKQTAGQTIGHILDTTDAAAIAPKLSASDIALEIAQDPEILDLAKVPGKEGTANQISNFLNTLYKNGDNLTLRDAQRLRQGIDDSINYNKRVPDMAGAQPYLYKMRDAISKKMNEAVNSLSGGQSDQLKEANQAYSKIAQLQRIADNRAAALSSNREFSLTDTIAGVGGIATGHTPLGMAKGGIAAAVANKAARTFGNPLMATGANTASKAIEAAPGLLQSVPGPIGPAMSGVEASQGLLNKEKKKK